MPTNDINEVLTPVARVLTPVARANSKLIDLEYQADEAREDLARRVFEAREAGALLTDLTVVLDVGKSRVSQIANQGALLIARDAEAADDE